MYNYECIRLKTLQHSTLIVLIVHVYNNLEMNTVLCNSVKKKIPQAIHFCKLCIVICFMLSAVLFISNVILYLINRLAVMLCPFCIVF